MYLVAVVDDEDIIRKGIVNLIDWENYDCKIIKESSDGNQLLDYMKGNRVDIIVTDIRMPNCDGIELLKKVKENFAQTEVIVLTAYSDFRYAQRAIRYGAVDFVIKNDFISDLPKALVVAVERLNEKSDEHFNFTNQEFVEMKANILKSIMLSVEDKHQNIIKKFQMDVNNYCICSCDIEYHNEELSLEEIAQMIKNLFYVICDSCEYYIVNVALRNVTIIMSRSIEHELLYEEISYILSEILRVVEEFMRINLKLGVSSIINDIYMLPKALEESKNALSKSFSLGNEVVFYFKETYNRNENTDLDIKKLSTEILELLFSAKIELALLGLGNLKNLVAKHNISFEKIKMILLNLCSTALRKFSEVYISDMLENMDEIIYKEINQATTIYSSFNACEKLVLQIEKNIGIKKYEKHYLISKIDEYIKVNYQNKFSLQDIANEIHVSTTYVSRLYKNKVGITITDAVNIVRIEQSKKLLKHTTLKIYEIAQIVGINDAAYFTNVFTKLEGINPSDFREKIT